MWCEVMQNPMSKRRVSSNISTFFFLAVKNRIQTLDFLRGFSIFAMTVFHQSLVFSGKGVSDNPVISSIVIYFGYIAAPFFIAVSGMSLHFFEKKYTYPVKIVVHGLVLFSFATMLDIIFHRSWSIDWDIFQVIGMSISIFGLLDLINGRIRTVVLAIVVAFMSLNPSLQPLATTGVFPVWPYAFYFIAGFFISYHGTSTHSRTWINILLSVMCVSYIGYYISLHTLPSRQLLEGIIFLLAQVFLLLMAGLFVEHRITLANPYWNFFTRYGKYSLSLYFFQQFFVRQGSALLPAENFLVRLIILLLIMFAVTFLFDRFPYLDASWWLRKVESTILRLRPISKLSTLKARLSGVKGEI